MIENQTTKLAKKFISVHCEHKEIYGKTAIVAKFFFFFGLSKKVIYVVKSKQARKFSSRV